MAHTVHYQEGDVFAVPLREGGYGLGVVAWTNGEGPVLGYFFGPARDVVPSLREIEKLEAKENVLVQKFGDLGLLRGEWRVIGSLPAWRPQEWGTPAFGRHEVLSGRFLRVEYADGDPSSQPQEFEISREEFEQLPSDGLAGAGFVERRLTRLLATAA